MILPGMIQFPLSKLIFSGGAHCDVGFTVLMLSPTPNTLKAQAQQNTTFELK